MVNSDNGIALGLEILRGIARQSAWPGYLPEPLEVVNLPSDNLAPISGRYQLNSDEAFKLEARANRLFGKSSSGEEYELLKPAGLWPRPLPIRWTPENTARWSSRT